MGYLIAYLLLALVFDLLRELVNPAPCDDNATAVRRCLWSESEFDCYSKIFSPNTFRLNSFPKHNRLSFLVRKIKSCPLKSRLKFLP